MTKQEIDQKYLDQVKALEGLFFDIADEGKPEQRRVLKRGKSLGEFNAQHGQIWKDHHAELLAEGFITPDPSPPPPARDLAKELDELKGRIATVETKVGIERM